MYSPLSRIGYPIAKVRLFMSLVAAVFFGFLLYFASVNLKWFTVSRGLYLLLGIAEGILMGELEARIVIRKLMKETETVVWQILPISAVLLGLPLLLAITSFDSLEFLLSMAYLVLPFVPVFYAVSGWCFNKFEKENNVQVFMFIYGFKYWTEPILSDSIRLSHFIEDVKSKDTTLILNHAAYSKRLMALLKERLDIEPKTRSALLNILQVLDEYRYRRLTLSVIFIALCILLIIYFFALASTNTFGLVEVVDHKIVSGYILNLVLICIPAFSVLGGAVMAALFLKKRYRKRIQVCLTNQA